MTWKRKGIKSAATDSTPNQTTPKNPEPTDPNQALQGARPLIEASAISQTRDGVGYSTALKMAESGTLKGVVKQGRYWRVMHGSFDSVVQKLIRAGDAK